VYLEEAVDRHQSISCRQSKIIGLPLLREGWRLQPLLRGWRQLQPTASSQAYMDPSMPVRYYYYCYCLLRVALCFSVTSSIVSFRAISAMSLAYLAFLLTYSRDSLTLPGSGTCPFLWQSGRRLRSSEYFLQCHNCLICKLKVAPEQCSTEPLSTVRANDSFLATTW
jgi:hypothetical protein